jgi:hypothetical protein
VCEKCGGAHFRQICPKERRAEFSQSQISAGKQLLNTTTKQVGTFNKQTRLFFGTRPKGDICKFGNREIANGPATRPALISLTIFSFKILGLSLADFKFQLVNNCSILPQNKLVHLINKLDNNAVVTPIKVDKFEHWLQ